MSFYCLYVLLALGMVAQPSSGAGAPSNQKAVGSAPNESARQERVVGGEPCKSPSQFPWLAGIVMDNGNSFCTGALISSTTVLTAAHCVAGRSNFVVSLGDFDLFNSTDQVLIVLSNKAIHHQNYSRERLENDVAVIILPQAVPESENVSCARLPTRSMANASFSGRLATIAGFGTSGDLGTGPYGKCNFAHNRTIMSNADCKIYHKEDIRETNICVDTRDGVATCSGDSGSMLMLQSEDGGYYHVGVASWGSGLGCRVGLPKVSSRTTSYLDWIEANGEGVVIEQ